jgi:hypothetical protein
MTMRVYRVNCEGTVVEDRGTVSIRHGQDPPPDTPLPPCTCRRCRNEQPDPSDRPALRTVAMRVAATWLLDQTLPLGRETVKLFAQEFRRFLWQLIPHIEQLTSGRPEDDGPAKVVRARVGEARRHLVETENTGVLGDIERVRPLARSVVGLCDHFDALTGTTTCLACDKRIEDGEAAPDHVHARCAGAEYCR